MHAQSSPTPPIRQPAWDVLRVVAMVLVVVLHACVAYMVWPIERLLWPAQLRGSAWVDHLFHVVRCLGVPVVSIVAGAVAWDALQRHGARRFLRERTRRLGVPLLAGMIVILGPMYAIWAWGWIERGWAAPEHILKFRFGPAVQPNLYGLGHLWYLQYLLLYACACAAWHALGGSGMNAKVRGAHQTRPMMWIVRVGVLALATTIVLSFWPASVVSFHNGFVPEPGQFVKHGLLFALGVCLTRALATGATLCDMTRDWVFALVLAVVGGLLLAQGMTALHAEPKPAWPPRWPARPFAPESVDAAMSSSRLVLMMGASLLTWFGAWAMLGIAARVPTWPGNRLVPLAQASMGVYLTHLLVQGVLVVVLYQGRHTWAASMPIGVGIALLAMSGLAVPLAVMRLVDLVRERARRA